jgi:hypothetical protein
MAASFQPAFSQGSIPPATLRGRNGTQGLSMKSKGITSGNVSATKMLGQHEPAFHHRHYPGFTNNLASI